LSTGSPDDLCAFDSLDVLLDNIQSSRPLTGHAHEDGTFKYWLSRLGRRRYRTREGGRP
jgi:hypothetical protein